MSEAMTKTDPDAEVMERVLLLGDLAKLSPQERSTYYLSVCRSVGLNPLTQPFAYLNLNGKLTLYAQKNATDQLRAIYKVSIYKLERELVDGLAMATAYARKADGTEDADVGAVDVTGLSGEKLANALMKTCTKAKRRVTLSICGLSFLDETELETVASARRVNVTPDGEILPDAAEPAGEDLVAQLEATIAALPKDRDAAKSLYQTIRGTKLRPAVKEKLLAAMDKRVDALAKGET